MEGMEIPNKILVYRCGTIGDTIVAVPAINLLQKKFPEAKFYLMTANSGFTKIWADVVLKDFNLMDGYLTYESSGFFNLRSYSHILHDVGKLNPDLVVYMSSDNVGYFRILRDLFFFKLAGCKNILTIYPTKKNKFNSNNFLYPSEVIRLAEGLRKIDIKADNVSFNLPIDSLVESKIKLFISTNSVLQKGKIIAVCPWSKMQAKRWAIGRFKELGERILSNYDVVLAVIGGHEEQEVGKELCEHWGNSRTINLANKISIAESFILLKNSLAYLGNDTGAMHLAAAAGVPCIAIFSARAYPGIWYPFGGGHKVIRKNVECQYCGLEVCIKEKQKCLTSISVDEVYEKFAELMKRIG